MIIRPLPVREQLQALVRLSGSVKLIVDSNPDKAGTAVRVVRDPAALLGTLAWLLPRRPRATGTPPESAG